MSSLGPTSFRTTTMLSSDRLLDAIRRTQAGMDKYSQQISSGKAVSKPSDAPAKTAAILLLQRQLAAREQHDQNMQFASGILNNIDQSLSDATNIALDAKTLGSSQIGIGSNADTRANQAAVVDQQIQALIDLANRREQNVSLFGGSLSPLTSQNNGNVFVEFLGGVRYIGARTNIAADIGQTKPLEFNANGIEAFGALSTRVESTVDMNPAATAGTHLADVNGAQGFGVRKGSVVVNVDGSDVTVDLIDADTLGDVVARVNDAIGSVDAAAGSMAINSTGFALTATAGHTITIGESGAGVTAADLGINNLSATAATVSGVDVDPRLTQLSTLASLGVSVDWLSGLKITQGDQTRIADFSTATTIQDLSNQIDKLGLGLRLEINAAGNSLNLVSEVSGLNLSIGESSGGTTATDLGLRTFGTDTQLSDFNFGIGIHRTPGNDDFAIQVHDGTTFNVNLDGVTDVAGVLAKVQAAAVAAGLSVGTPGTGGTDFNLGMASDGNGFVFEDGTAGANNFKVTQLNSSLAATDLGFYQDAVAGSTIAGTDNTQVRADSIFSHLISLRDALVKNDTRGITVATSGLESDIDKLTRIRADVGVRAQRVTQQQDRSSSLKLAEQTMLSSLQDTDMTEAITRFTQLQQQLEATIRAGMSLQQMSLLDFLR